MKVRTFAEGSRGYHALSGWMHEILMQKNVTLYATCDMNLYCVVCRFYHFHITRSYKAQVVYLEAQVVSLLGARNLASMRGKGKLNMFG